MAGSARSEEPHPGSGRAWHAQDADSTLAALDTTRAGLTSEEAAARLTHYGANEIRATRRITGRQILLAQFRNILILILIAGAALSFFMGHTVESIVIAVIVAFSVVLGFLQEYRAERALEALRELAAPTATVIRDGVECALPTRDLVPGDVILLHVGDRVPADGRLLQAINLMADEAPLTGESLPVDKASDRLPDVDLPVGDRHNMVHAGTTITHGRGTAVLVATGMDTEFGRIAQLLQSVEAVRTPLQKNIDRVGSVLARIALVIVLLIVGLGLLRGQPVLEMFIFGIALAVAVVPEALPAVVTISLAIGVQRMARRNALIRRLPAVETLGSTSVICSDKTGTLTRDEMTARRIWLGGQVWSVSGAGYEPVGTFTNTDAVAGPTPELLRLLAAGVLSSDSELRSGADGWSVTGDPTEGALVVAAAKAGLDKAALEAEAPRTQEIPFTSESKRMTTLHRTARGAVAYTKGAPEMLLPDCAHVLTPTGVAPLDAERRQQLAEVGLAFAGDALRVLAIATREGTGLEDATRAMTLLGLVGMIDPPRPEAKEAITICRKAGIRPVMITGDHPVTAEAIATELGLLRDGRVVTGAELDEMSDAQLEREVGGIDVFARVSPAHKLRVVTALQADEQVVAMTGDGVNDAPALKKADIGIAMGLTGTDVTKEASAMTLTDDNFASIVAAVEEGRGVFSNIKKYLMYLLSSNIGEIGLMVAAALAGLPLPLSAVQILYVNLATDGLPALALAVDPPERDLMEHKPRSPRTGIFTRPVVFLMVTGGVWSALINLALFLWALNSGRTLQESMTMVFVSLVLVQFLKAYNFRSDRNSLFQRPFENRWLNLAIVWEALLLVTIIYFPPLTSAFGAYPLPIVDWLIVAVVSLTVLPVLELAKAIVRKGWLDAEDHLGRGTHSSAIRPT